MFVFLFRKKKNNVRKFLALTSLKSMQLIRLKFIFFAIPRISCLSLFSPGFSLIQLSNQSKPWSRPFTGLSLEAIRLFKISPAEVKKIRKLGKWLDPNVIERKH